MSFLGIFLPKARLPSAAMPPHLEALPCTGLPMPISTHTIQSLPKDRGVVAGCLAGILFHTLEIMLEITVMMLYQTTRLYSQFW